MALVNDHSNEPNYIIKQNSSSSEDLSSPENYGLDQPEAAYAGGGGGGGGASASSSSTTNSDHQQNHQGFVFYPSGESVEDHNSLMDFNGSSFLNFDHNDHHETFPPPAISCGASSGLSFLEGNNMSYGFTNWSQHHMDIISPRPIETPGTNQGHKDWLYSDSTVVTTGSRYGSISPKPTGNKRSYTGEIIQPPSKKPSSGTSGKAKPKPTNSPKDPQSLAAKNRRERISERLKILQELVPNGTKVDLVTMLEKAISYVKFLQVQVKVLATDEFWPAQGGKAPDISQVKDAIDAILSSSQRDRNSNPLTN